MSNEKFYVADGKVLLGKYISSENVEDKTKQKWKSIADPKPMRTEWFIEQCFIYSIFSQCTFNVYVLCWRRKNNLNWCLMKKENGPIINYVIITIINRNTNQRT